MLSVGLWPNTKKLFLQLSVWDKRWSISNSKNYNIPKQSDHQKSMNSLYQILFHSHGTKNEHFDYQDMTYEHFDFQEMTNTLPLSFCKPNVLNVGW